jgi:hypothetical protein
MKKSRFKRGMHRLKSLITELFTRYASAIIVGLGFLAFSSLVADRFMNHLGMQGSILPYELGLLMLFEVPVWMLLAWLFKPIAKGPVVEIVIAGLVAIAMAQFLYFDVFWTNFILPTVDPSTKGMMLLWYVATVTNYMLATLAAILYCTVRGFWVKPSSSRG